MMLYRVKWTGPAGGWTGKVFTSRDSALAWVGNRLYEHRQVTVQEADVEWGDPVAGEEWAP